jgi:hypothetical protein
MDAGIWVATAFAVLQQTEALAAPDSRGAFAKLIAHLQECKNGKHSS